MVFLILYGTFKCLSSGSFSKSIKYIPFAVSYTKPYPGGLGLQNGCSPGFSGVVGLSSSHKQWWSTLNHQALQSGGPHLPWQQLIFGLFRVVVLFFGQQLVDTPLLAGSLAVVVLFLSQQWVWWSILGSLAPQSGGPLLVT